MARKTDKESPPPVRRSNKKVDEERENNLMRELKEKATNSADSCNYSYEKNDFYDAENKAPKVSDNSFTFYDSALLNRELAAAKEFAFKGPSSSKVYQNVPKRAHEPYSQQHLKRASAPLYEILEANYPGAQFSVANAYNEPEIVVQYDNQKANQHQQQATSARKQPQLYNNQVSRAINMTDNFTQTAGRSSNSKDENTTANVILSPSLNRKNRNKRYALYTTLIILSIFIGIILLGYTAFKVSRNNSVAVVSKITFEDPSLRQVVILFRHGDRSPTETYKNDPYKDYAWENGWGTLQKKGMKRMYKLGQWIRYNYGWLNNGKYNNSNTYAESSYADRCIESTQSLLAGLYPVDPKDAFVQNLNWRPIPVHSTPKNLDKIIVVKYPCPKLDKLLAEAYNQTLTEDLINYFKEVSEITGQEMKTITDVEFLYNTLEIEEQEGLKLPAKIKKLYKEPKMLEIAKQSYAIFTYDRQQKRLRGGPLLNSVLKSMEDFDRGLKQFKIHLYGVHDITIVNLLRTMGIEKYNGSLLKPGLGATLIFELRQLDSEDAPTVKLFYMDDSSTEIVTPLSIPNCLSEICQDKLENVSLNQLRKNYEAYIPKNWDEECVNEIKAT